MSINRREFVKVSTMATAALLLAKEKLWAALAQTQPLRKFIQPLRYFGVPGGIPLASADPAKPYGDATDFYQIAMRQFEDTLHPELGGPTILRGYSNLANTGSHKHLEGAIVATVNRPVRVRWSNQLPLDIPLPVDPTLIQPFGFGQPLMNDRAAPHLHGGLVPWPSDGGPFHWFNNPANGGKVTGPSVVNWLDGTDDYWYPNVLQTPRFMWYHDHAVGLTRLNPYLGMASGYILTDDSEGLLPPSVGTADATLMAMLGIPVGDLTRQVHLVVQDKIFAPSDYNGGRASNLWYPDFYDTQFFDLEKGKPAPATPSLVPEFWGDTMLMNGTVYPYIDVEPRRYRFRILNACNTRFLSLRLVGAMGRTGAGGYPNPAWNPASTEPNLALSGPPMTLIGTEGGFLDGSLAPKGVVYNNTAAMPLVLAPAERADIIIDFGPLATAAAKGSGALCFILHNDAPVPFPGGTPLGDFYPANKRLAAPPTAGFGPNTRTLLQFRVWPLKTFDQRAEPTQNPAWTLPQASAPQGTVVSGTRDLALYETSDDDGRLAQNLGPLSGPMGLLDAPTEVVTEGTVETWRIFNTTADAHPIHFHYFNVRVVSRQPFSWRGGTPNLTGGPLAPDPAEQGWKETVKFYPGECTTLLVEMPPTAGLAPVQIPNSPRLETYRVQDPAFPNDRTKTIPDPSVQGAEYVWHCHILEHEEHDMMRPLIVQPNQSLSAKPRP